MKIETDDRGHIVISDIFNDIRLQPGGDRSNSIPLHICERDGGHEIHYAGRKYRAVNGTLEEVGIKSSLDIIRDIPSAPEPPESQIIREPGLFEF